MSEVAIEAVGQLTNPADGSTLGVGYSRNKETCRLFIAGNKGMGWADQFPRHCVRESISPFD